METNPLFTIEAVQQIVVPDVVKQDLLSILEEKLNRAGFYYRLAYRVKEAGSMVNKLIYKDYGRAGGENEDKKMQDLIGIRIMLYFEDDLPICKSLLNSLFAEPGVWETTENNEYEFKAMKRNGIFRLPAYLAKLIVNPQLSDYVDDTFEVQVRTNSFEGWHEIEHDLRYKGSAFGEGNESLARKMNSILATLELCDDSLVKLLEDLGHQHYKDHKWSDMVRCHYRLKFGTTMLHPLAAKVLDEDTELAKSIFKYPRANVIKYLWENTSDRDKDITITQIVKVVNQLELKDERLFDAFEQIEKMENAAESVYKRKKFEPFKKLGKYKVFKAITYLDTSVLSEAEAHKKAAGYVHSWIKSRYSSVFEHIPESVSDYRGYEPGYSVEVKYDESKLFFEEKTMHIDSKISSRLWISHALLKKDEKGIAFIVTNEYSEPTDRYRDTENIMFSRPNFYGEIADNIGIKDIVRLKENVRYINTDNYDSLGALINNPDRQFPVIVFIGEDEVWTDRFDIDYFAYLVGYYAHIVVISDEESKLWFSREHDLDSDQYRDSITVFYKNSMPKTSYKSDILETTFEVIKFEQKKYWNENGCRAYRRQLVADIREDNVK